MKWTGKIIGAIIGLCFGSLITVIIGVIIGHLYDIGWFSKWFGFQGRERQHDSVQTVFFNSTFMIMGYLAKCDGRVSENEIRIAEHVMQEMNLDANMRREAIRLFNEGKQAD